MSSTYLICLIGQIQAEDLDALVTTQETLTGFVLGEDDPCEIFQRITEIDPEVPVRALGICGALTPIVAGCKTTAAIGTVGPFCTAINSISVPADLTTAINNLCGAVGTNTYTSTLLTAYAPSTVTAAVDGVAAKVGNAAFVQQALGTGATTIVTTAINNLATNLGGTSAPLVGQFTPVIATYSTSPTTFLIAINDIATEIGSATISCPSLSGPPTTIVDAINGLCGASGTIIFTPAIATYSTSPTTFLIAINDIATEIGSATISCPSLSGPPTTIVDAINGLCGVVSAFTGSTSRIAEFSMIVCGNDEDAVGGNKPNARLLLDFKELYTPGGPAGLQNKCISYALCLKNFRTCTLTPLSCTGVTSTFQCPYSMLSSGIGSICNAAGFDKLGSAISPLWAQQVANDYCDCSPNC